MFKLPTAFSIPVQVRPVTFEGETIEAQSFVTVATRRTKTNPAGQVKFVLEDCQIRDERIAVRVIKYHKRSAVVEPLADYVPFLWGLIGAPPRQFTVPRQILLPD